MKQFMVVLSALLLATQTFAQNSLSGQVTDRENNEPLPGAHIYLPDLQKGTTSDKEGHFEITDLPKGDFLVEVGYISFSTQVLKVNIDGASTLDVSLSPSITEMSEIVITGTSASTERKMNPVPTLVISDVSDNQTPSNNLIDAIASQPGVSQITTGGAISKPVIRGLGFNRVVVLNNNVRQEGQQWGAEHGVEIDEYAVDRVEIIKGPGSLMYGSDAIAGVLHFLAPKPLAEGTIIGNVLSNYQSNNSLLGFSGMTAGNVNGINWLVRGSSKTAGNFENTYDGKVYNSGFESLNFSGRVGLSKRWGYSHFNVSSFNQTLGIVEGERDSLGNFMIDDDEIASDDLLNGYSINSPNQEVSHLSVSNSSKFFFNNESSLAVNLAFQQNDRKEFHIHHEEHEHEGEEEEEEGPELGLHLVLSTFNYDAKYLLAQKKGWSTSVGVNGMAQTNVNNGEEYLIPNYELFDVGGYLFTQRSFEKLQVSGGVRYDVRSLTIDQLIVGPDTAQELKFAAAEKSFSNISASLGGSYRLNDVWVLKANAARGFRSPNVSELASNGSHEGTFRYELGNADLESETSMQFDVGVLFNSEHVSVELAAFHNTIANFIFLQKLNSASGGDSIVDDHDPSPAFQYVQGNASLYGGEVAVDIHPHPLDWLHFETSFSFVKGELADQPDSTTNLPFIPAPQLRSVLRADFHDVGKLFKNLYLRVGISHTMEQGDVYWAFGTETPTGSYTLLNASIGSDIVNKDGNTLCSLSVAGGNLLDAGYQSHLSRLKYAPENIATSRTGVFNMGRNFSVRLVVPFTVWKREKV